MAQTLRCRTLRASLISDVKRRRALGGPGDVRPQHLERDRLVELEIAGLVDDTHASLAEGLDDLVALGEHGPADEEIEGLLCS